MRELFYVFIGGGVGSCLRFSISAFWMHMRLNPAYASILFPWPTFIANILGCFLIGVFYAKGELLNIKPEILLLLTTGLCGGFTTFSTFSYESLSLLRSGHYSIFATYIVLSITLGIFSALLPSLLK